MRKLQFILITLLTQVAMLSAVSFRHINAEQGLSSRQVFQVLKDSEGFVWIFTHLGVDRYDGTEMRHYKLDESLESKDHILASTIFTIDNAGTLWVSMKNGTIYVYDRLTDSFSLRFNIHKYLPEAPALNDIFFDRNNRLWMGLSSGLHYYDTEADSIVALSGLENQNITRMTQAESGDYYVGTSSSLYRFRDSGEEHAYSHPLQIELGREIRVESLCPVGNKLYVGTFNQSLVVIDIPAGNSRSLASIIPSVPIRTIKPFGDDRILIATDGSGVYCINRNDNTLVQRFIADEDNRSSLSGNTVSDLMVDERNCVWVATYTNGISVFDPQYPDINWIRHEHGSRNSLASNHVNVILEDSDGDLWYGTNNGVSLYRVRSGQWTHFLDDKGGDNEHSSVILALCEDNKRRIWAGGYGTGGFLINKQSGQVERIKRRGLKDHSGLTTDYIYSIHVDGDFVWIGGIQGELARYHVEDKTWSYFPVECIGDIREGNNNTLLLACCDGLAILHKTDGSVDWYRTFDNHTLRYPIRCLIQSASGDIWMATDGEGFIRFNPETKDSEFFTIHDDIASNAINGVLEDGVGNIWFTTAKDLYYMDPRTGQVKSMNEFLWLAWGNYNPGAAILRKDGKLMFGTANGAIEFVPYFPENDHNSIRLLFTDFKLLYKSVQAGAEESPLQRAIDHTEVVKLPYKQNFFSISFSAIDFVAPHQIDYLYKLDSFDDDWRLAGTTHQVDYMNLSSGKYKFQLKAVNKYTHQTLAERSINIAIGQPFWATPWAFLLYLLAVGLLLYLIIHFIRNRIEDHNAKEKIRFFINVAHDIRTPVTLIKAPLTELESSESLSERERKSLSVATANADKLFLMVSQLLDLQKIDLKAEQLSISRQNVQIFMQGKINDFRLSALQKWIELKLDIAPDFPEVWFDSGKMDKVMENLLSNAIKYTEKGSVSIILDYTASNWSVEIKDTGIGIPANDQKHLFKQFYRAGNAVNSNETGSGIGLLLTKKLVELHQGAISFSSVENSGSSFILTFPYLTQTGKVEEKEELAEPAKKKKVRRPAASKVVVLLAEDNNEVREYLRDSLAEEYEVVAVADGGEALKLAREINPDIIISDILMPVMRGDEVCRKVKSNVDTSHIPFILLSALNEKENVILGLESGADDYIIKPFDLSVLKARIRNILQSRERFRKTLLSSDIDTNDIDYGSLLDKEFLDKAIAVIHSELANPEFSINEFCKILGMSRTSVYNKIKSLTDYAPNDFIRVIRLNKARDLLISKRYTITEVSYLVGFSDPKYFSTSFKKQFGITPSRVE